ncbi:MAG: UPF0182 family protein [Nanoarchaeota archaeon]
MSKTWFRAILISLFIILVFFTKIASFITDYLWFKALGFTQIFLITFKSKIGLFIIGAAFFFIFALINLLISSRKSKVPIKIKIGVVLILSALIGIILSSKWFLVLQYLYQVPFGITDPVFFKDVSFYVFSLPFFILIYQFAMACLVITIILITLDYFSPFIKNMFEKVDPVNLNTKRIFKPVGIQHIAILASVLFVLFSVRNYLSRFSIMFSEKGVVVGAGYTDVVAILPITKIMIFLALVAAVMIIVWAYKHNQKKPVSNKTILYIIGAYFVISILGTMIIPGIFQSLIVSPNEINLEKPYIDQNIEFTKIAYGLTDVVERDFSVEMNLTSDILGTDTLNNVRILDWRPLTQTYKQTQEIRLYYDLSSIDIDRYNLSGKLTQVMVAPRELDQSQIAQNAKTWVNLHMVYTHGYGIVMSPVNRVTKQGLPEFLIQDIPPVYNTDDIRIVKPQIYYGEKKGDFVLVNTKTDEFDYPKGNINEYINYDGNGGVVLDTFFKKILMAFRFGDIKILLSSDITKTSKIMFLRNIQDRISKITPFLILDNDPYMVVADGRFYWIQDAYTVSGNFPYSQKYNGINYIRNSVKIVLDAYNGDVSYYVMEEKDPLILTYGEIFPKQFKLFESMPESLKKHIRYPEDLFKIQSEIYSVYHMNDATVFYNKEDAWQIPFELYGTSQKVQVEPYYIIMKLPDEKQTEFILMTSFTPIKKDNMVSWFAARNDLADYGKLILYKFPKDKLVYGPLQIEARFDQDSEISGQLTLWSQQGSSVTRGNLLVIPIDKSLLYIEPLYLQAEKGQLPELKRILVSDGERVVMEVDLTTALEVLFGKARDEKVSENTVNEDKTDSELISDAQVYYNSILSAMENKDWAGFGENFDKLGDVLGRISR